MVNSISPNTTPNNESLILLLVGRGCHALSAHRRKVRLVIRVDEGSGCRLRVSRAHPVASAKDS